MFEDEKEFDRQIAYYEFINDEVIWNNYEIPKDDIIIYRNDINEVCIF